MTYALSSSSTQTNTPAGWQVKDDGSGNLVFIDPAGNEIYYMDSITNDGALVVGGEVDLQASGTAHLIAIGDPLLSGQHAKTRFLDMISNVYYFFSPPDAALGAAQALRISVSNIHAGTPDLSIDSNIYLFANGQTHPTTSGKFAQSYGVNLAGYGFPHIYAAGAQTLYTNAAPTTMTYTPPLFAGVYRLNGYLNALTAGTMTFKAKITYTDAGGTPRTDIPAFYRQNTAAVIAGGMTANTADRYTMIPYTFSVDASGGAIAIQDNAGTYTAGTYYWTPFLEQIA